MPRNNHRPDFQPTREPRDTVLVDDLKHGRTIERVYYTSKGRRYTRDPNKATRVTRARAEEVRKNWGGKIEQIP